MSDGMDCTCAAYGECECACGADWTPQEVYDLRAELDARCCDVDRWRGEYVKAEADKAKIFALFAGSLHISYEDRKTLFKKAQAIMEGLMSENCEKHFFKVTPLIACPYCTIDRLRAEVVRLAKELAEWVVEPDSQFVEEMNELVDGVETEDIFKGFYEYQLEIVDRAEVVRLKDTITRQAQAGLDLAHRVTKAETGIQARELQISMLITNTNSETARRQYADAQIATLRAELKAAQGEVVRLNEEINQVHGEMKLNIIEREGALDERCHARQDADDMRKEVEKVTAKYRGCVAVIGQLREDKEQAKAEEK